MNNKMQNRIIVSETFLPRNIITEWDVDIVNFDFLKESLTFSECDKLFKYFSKQIEKEAKKIQKSIRGRVEGVAMDVMYSHLDDADWYQAALIVEIFRDPDISKNAGNIDTRTLQKKIHYALKEETIEFLIGWGQAKRYCGGLKTEGYSADFSELYSILTLYIIIQSIHNITGKHTTLTILTGGTRFYSALFTGREKIKQYDRQRQAIADHFATEYTSINFIDYHSTDKNTDDKLNEFCEMIKKTEIDNTFQTVLMNVDWYSVLIKTENAPHGVKIPPIVVKYLKEGGDVDMLIRMGIVSILNRNTHTYWIEKIGNVELFDETVDFFYEVSRESTKKYLAIHLMDADIDETIQSKSHERAIRLTVHEKKDRKDIPAILTLGRRGGNKLSQHVCGFVSQDGVSFDAVFNISVKLKGSDKKIKRVMPPEEGIFNWLTGGEQPFFYSNTPKEKYLETLFKLKFIEE